MDFAKFFGLNGGFCMKAEKNKYYTIIIEDHFWGNHLAGDIIMELHISDEKTKELLSEVVVELLQTKKNLLYDVIIEALEDVGLENAIAEGRKNDFVPEDEIFFP